MSPKASPETRLLFIGDLVEYLQESLKKQLSVCSVLNTVLGIGDTAVNNRGASKLEESMYRHRKVICVSQTVSVRKESYKVQMS